MVQQTHDNGSRTDDGVETKRGNSPAIKPLVGPSAPLARAQVAGQVAPPSPSSSTEQTAAQKQEYNFNFPISEQGLVLSDKLRTLAAVIEGRQRAGTPMELEITREEVTAARNYPGRRAPDSLSKNDKNNPTALSSVINRNVEGATKAIDSVSAVRPIDTERFREYFDAIKDHKALEERKPGFRDKFMKGAAGIGGGILGGTLAGSTGAWLGGKAGEASVDALQNAAKGENLPAPAYFFKLEK